MNTQIGLLTEIRQATNSMNGVLHLDSPFTILPGQYFQASRVGDNLSLPEILFPALLREDNSLVLNGIPFYWLPGDQIYINGPLGNGFSLPSDSHFVALLSPDGDFERLMPLANLALKQNASISLILGTMPDREGFLSNLPEAMEVHDLSNIQNALNWADFLAIDLKIEDLINLESLLGISEQDIIPIRQGQVLLRAKMPCAGRAQCGICGIKTRSGWKLVCEDGPVFPLEVLRNVAG